MCPDRVKKQERGREAMVMKESCILARLERLRDKMQEKGLEAAFFQNEANVSYLSGFSGGESFLLVTARDRGEANLFLTDSRYQEQAEKELETAEKSLQEAETKLQAAEERLTTAQDAKEQTLQNLQQTDSKYKDMAKKCEQMQKQVENAQETYDTSLETFDNTSANYERLNTELQSQQGILNQLEVYQAKLDNIQAASDKVTQLEEQINQKLQAKDQMTKEMLEHANASEGCSASKTPAENLLSMKDGPKRLNQYAYTETPVNINGMQGVDPTQSRAQLGRSVIEADASFFEASGCIANSDGSYTNSENGMTWINLDNNTWVRTDTLNTYPEYMSMAQERYPDVASAFERSQAQNNDYGIQGLRPNDNLRKFMDF